MAHHPAGIELVGRPKAEGNRFAERRTKRTAIRSLHEMAGVSDSLLYGTDAVPATAPAGLMIPQAALGRTSTTIEISKTTIGFSIVVLVFPVVVLVRTVDATGATGTLG